MRSRFAPIGLLAFFLLPAASHGVPVLWHLENVSFADGAAASGSFVYDADREVFLSIDIVTTAGPLGAGARYRAPNPDSPGNAEVLVAVPDATLGDLAGEPLLGLAFDGMLTNAGGTLEVDLGGFSVEGLCSADGARTCAGPVVTPRGVLSGRVTTRPPSQPQPRCFLSGAGATRNCYELVTEQGSLDWEEARVRAEQRRFLDTVGRLATINSTAESRFIRESLALEGRQPYLGGRCLDGRCDDFLDYEWITGEPARVIGWCEGEPDGDDTQPAVLHIFQDDYCWNDVAGSGSDGLPIASYLVEYELSNIIPACYDHGPGATGSCYENVDFGGVLASWGFGLVRALDERFLGRSGRLATITSAEEQDFIAANVSPPRAFEPTGLEVTTPAAIAGSYRIGLASFGAQLDRTGPVAGTLAEALDTADPATDGCEELTEASAAALVDRIALVDRGECPFVDKVRRAQEAGAIAVIIADNQPGFTSGIGGQDPEGTITIPTIIVAMDVGAALRDNIDVGTDVILSSVVSDAVRPYIGGTCNDGSCDDENDFRWITGEPVSYLNWCPPSEPNGDPGGVLQFFDDRFCWNDTTIASVLSNSMLVEIERRSDAPSCFRFGPGATQSCYEVVVEPELMSWEEALSAAANRSFEGRPGRLATITSAEEAAFIAAVDGGRLRLAESRHYATLNPPSSGRGSYEGSGASFGPMLDAAGLAGEVVLASDGEGFDNDGCEPLTTASAAEINTRIALIDRGQCEFATKVRHAQEAGAVAVLIANNRPGAGTEPLAAFDANDIEIPSMMLSFEAGEEIRPLLGDGFGMTLLRISNGELLHYLGGRCDGGDCDGPESFSWITDEPVSFLGWCASEPNRDAFGVLQFFNDRFCWNDVNSQVSGSRSYVVEYPSDTLSASSFENPEGVSPF